MEARAGTADAAEPLLQQLAIGTPAESSEDDAVLSPEQAHRVSAAASTVLQAGVYGGLDPGTAQASVAAARTILHEQEGPGLGGKHRSLLLPSGIVLHYREWGSETAPPIVLLHDIAENHRAWDGVAAAACAQYRVLCLDLRGHGATSRSPRRLYGLDELMADLHELVVQLSLNGRDWGGAFTRPWVLGGRGTGAAVAAAYAARELGRGRVAGLFLVDYDPSWPKDRTAFYRYQAAHFGSGHEAAAALNATLGLRGDAARIGRQLALRIEEAEEDEERSGARFRLDPFFLIHDLDAHVAARDLRNAAWRCHLELVHDEGASAWPRARAVELAEQLAGEQHALSAVATPVAAATQPKVEETALGAALVAFAARVDAAEAREARATRAAAAPPPPPGPARAASPVLSDGLRELRAKGEDLKALKELGRRDRAALKARLRELGYRGMRQRVQMEEELLASEFH